MKVLVDTNVVVDVLLKQEPFYRDSFVIFRLADNGNIDGILAAVSMTNVFYLLRKAKKDSAEVYRCLDDLTAIFTVAPVTETIVADALALRWKDFEDAIQFVTAQENGTDFIITRNLDDYKASDIPCMSPAEFIAYLKEKENL